MPLVLLVAVYSDLSFPMLVFIIVQTYLTNWLSKHRLESSPISMTVITIVDAFGSAGCGIFRSFFSNVSFYHCPNISHKLAQQTSTRILADINDGNYYCWCLWFCWLRYI